MDYKIATKEELIKFADGKREEVRALRFSASGSRNANVKAVRTLRKEVARALTEITAKAKNAKN